MNRVTLSGRLAKDPIITAGEKEGALLTIAVDKYGEGCDFISCSAWGKQVDFIDTYTKQGDLVLLEGSLTTYKDKEGRYKTGVIVSHIELMAKKKEKKEGK